MAGQRHWWAGGVTAVTAVLAALVGLGGCSDGDGTPSNPASKAASAASAASSLASQAAEGLASASAEAKRRLDGVKGGVNAKDEVKLGTPGTDPDGRVTVEVTADNKASETKSFAVQVQFNDANGNLLDTVVATVRDVRAGATGNATARSTRKLTGEVKTEVARALRY
ncbi:FxLYD domain-containing protein [Streptomyces sp. V3I7]|uniref:FxLYD domain-containing protein n=1 Tax=Streptomyces sp. V3I7 TaxID=3042278 RepID=UPI0027864AAF|nr:FxLYD domain-containing protein [Streptomyces sp. V3I7]MDQ0991975.1 hypothetical protein [Streptomyces sp. V3I7]